MRTTTGEIPSVRQPAVRRNHCKAGGASMGVYMMLGFPALLVCAVAPYDGAAAWLLLKYIFGCAALGGYCAAGWELLTVKVGGQQTTLPQLHWSLIAVLRLTVSMGLGIGIAMLILSFMNAPHPWFGGGVAFVFALSGLVAKPYIDRAVIRKLEQFDKAPGP